MCNNLFFNSHPRFSHAMEKHFSTKEIETVFLLRYHKQLKVIKTEKQENSPKQIKLFQTRPFIVSNCTGK